MAKADERSRKRRGSREAARRRWRDRPVEEEGDKDIKEGGVERNGEKPDPAPAD
jgi:hypothetical protein